MWLRAILVSLDSRISDQLISLTTKSPRIITQPLKRKVTAFFCGKLKNHAANCYKRHKKNEKDPSKAKLVKREDIIAVVVVSQVNIAVGNNE